MSFMLAEDISAQELGFGGGGQELGQGKAMDESKATMKVPYSTLQ